MKKSIRKGGIFTGLFIVPGVSGEAAKEGKTLPNQKFSTLSTGFSTAPGGRGCGKGNMHFGLHNEL